MNTLKNIGVYLLALLMVVCAIYMDAEIIIQYFYIFTEEMRTSTQFVTMLFLVAVFTGIFGFTAYMLIKYCRFDSGIRELN